MNESIEPSTSCFNEMGYLHPRREPFEYGLLPVSKLIFTDGTSTLGPLKEKFIERSFSRNSNSSGSSSLRIDANGIADVLQISSENAHLVLDTLAAVLPDYGEGGLNLIDPLASAKPEEIDSIGANIYDLILFLYIQSYKRLLPRAHKDSASVADVWPSTSAFDGYLSALSPLQIVRTSRRFMPSQADEEAHQLSYLQKHLPNILSLLGEPVENEEDGNLVLSLDRFEHLGLLFQFGEKGSEGIPLGQAAPFFANSDPDMPAVPVPASQVHDWILQNIFASLEHPAEKVFAKENGPPNASDLDVTMAEACVSHSKGQQGSQISGASTQSGAMYSRILSFVEGFNKASVVKRARDIRGRSVKVLNCHDSVIYILAPLRYATVNGCSDATIVLGAIGKVVKVEHCERVQVITATKRIIIANCRECVFYLGVNQRPLILGDNHKLQVAPYNTFYSQLQEHMAQVGIDPTINRWGEPMALGMIDPHDSLTHPAGVSDAQAESATCLDPDQFTNFLVSTAVVSTYLKQGLKYPIYQIPGWFGGESLESTKENLFLLPEIYMASQRKNCLIFGDIKKALRDIQIEENRKRELASALHVYFKDWLYASGNIRQLYCLQGD